MFDARTYTFCNDQGRIGSGPEVPDARFEPSAATEPEYAMTRKSSMLDGLFWGSRSGATLQREPSFQ